MSDDANLPKLADGAAISVTRHIRYHLDCPKCRKPLDVTDLAFGTILKCPGCKNITWRPQFQPRWYFRARNFILANVGSFILGILSNFASSYLWERYFQSKPVQTGTQAATTNNHP